MRILISGATAVALTLIAGHANADGTAPSPSLPVVTISIGQGVPAETPAEQPQQAAEGTARLAITADTRGIDAQLLQTRADGEQVSVARCAAPCTMAVPPGDYTIAARTWNNGTAETPVIVGPEGANVHLRGRPPQPGYYGLAAAGGVTATVGAVGIFYSAILTLVLSAFGDSQGTALGLGLLAGAGAITAGGIVGMILGLRAARGRAVRSELSPSDAAARAGWTLGVAPTANGASVGVALRF